MLPIKFKKVFQVEKINPIVDHIKSIYNNNQCQSRLVLDSYHKFLVSKVMRY